MASPRIMVVEDESIVGMDIKEKLKDLGYDVPALVSSGKEAVRKAVKIKPDLVLMDIVLKGDIDGVEAAKKIYSRTGIPVVYLTAHSDENTLQRAKITEPFGYILKPFEVRDLHTAIEIALYKDKKQKEFVERNKYLVSTLKSVGNAVITTDREGQVTYMNPFAELLTGLNSDEAFLKGLGEVFKVLKEGKGSQLESLARRTIRKENINRIKSPIRLITPDGKKLTVDVNAAPLRDDIEEITGVVLTFQDIMGQKPADLKSLERLKLKTAPYDEMECITMIVQTSSPLILEGIRKIIQTEKDIDIIDEASDSSEIIPIVELKKPNVLIIDTASHEIMIEELLDTIKGYSPETEIILYIHGVDEQFVINAISWGVRGFISDTSKPGHLIQAIRTVSNGHIWAELDILTKILTRILPSRTGKPKTLYPNLTKREKEIVKLVVQGDRNKAICKKLFISEKTVKSHLTNIFKKLGVRNRHQLAIRFEN